LFFEHKFFKQSSQVGIVWPILKPETAGVVHLGCKLSGLVLAELLYGCTHLLLHDLLILLLLGDGLKTLPGQTAPQELHQVLTQPLQVVPPALLDAKVGVDGGISRSSS